MKKRDIVKDTLRRFPNVPKKTLANYLINQYPQVFVNEKGETDIELARSLIRYYTRSKGAQSRNKDNTEFINYSIKMPPTIAVNRIPYKMKPGLWLVVADLHIPFHSIKALEIMLEYAQTQKVDGVFINGDLQDCEAIGTWPPTSKRDFNQEVELTIDFLDFFRKEFEGKKIIWKPGNHEDRLKNYYRNKAPQLADLPYAEMETILGLEDRNIEYLDRKQKVMFGKLPVLHGHEIRGGNVGLVSPARWLFLKAKSNAMAAHFHRTSNHVERTLKKETIVTWTTGCLCHLEPDFNPEANNWNWGFALVNIENGTFEVENREILENGQII